MSIVIAEDFWVYENWQAAEHHATYHWGECHLCKQGTGRSGKGTASNHGKWHGPYSLDKAQQPFTGNNGVTLTAAPCKRCSPQTVQ